MEKIIFFALALPILGYVFYLGSNAIMKGFKAKVDNRLEETKENENPDLSSNKDKLSNEIRKLYDLHQRGVLTQEEFEKAKKKLLDN